MNAETGWYPVAVADGLERATSTGTRLFGEEIVVWRDLEGDSHVWEDRCPHRGMRLSFGFVRGSQIACLYHGWHFDTEGQCRYIPAHPDLTPPQTIKVWRYQSAERFGLIWTTGREDAPPGPLPADRAVTPVRSIHIDAAPATVLERLNSADVPAFTGEGATVATEIVPWLMSLKTVGDELLVGVQPLSDGETALHMAIAGADGYRGAGQKHFSAWAEDFRRQVEARPAPATPAEYPVEAV